MTKSRSRADSKYLKALGHNIRTLRQKKGLSQEALAAKAELDRTYIGSVERGERNISALNIKKIADALETRPSYLLDLSGKTDKA